ncbi:TonB-dependent receptor [Sulfurimonas gotlandica GD1]|uniref:TonB-dependent receptor n=1 Tax=Sulfurimonas gotlandica (strain DSM 19862 / JCM 16533 / GD1) TaxID=929558 RepID=B6BIA9_SULGG|nr:TonB-dependent receptor [Sulfurimonas gotlandica]EDZ63577.1 putative outer membrane protein [Sulfurimonas gotlandica GD1]EHP30260.1 TonB-dependent receptor [Sulfurimonas gotlandica GD1]
MKKKLLLLVLPSFIFASSLQNALQEEISYLQEETFVTSASKVKENIKKTPASVTVITQEMIENMGANNIFDVLRSVPGLGVSQSNIYVDKITVRGIETWFSEKVLILLDGHSLNVDLLNGGATGAYKNIPIELIKRVEIIKGPASALYGENAFTALINIITKKAKDIDGAKVVVKYGSDNTKVANLSYGKTYDDFELTANLNYIKSDGDARFIASDAVGNSGYSNPTLDSFNGYLSLVHKNGFYATGNINTTEDGPRYGVAHALNNEDISKKITYFIELGYKNRLNEYLDLHIRAYYDSFKVDNTWRVFPAGSPAPAFTNGMLGYVGYETNKLGAETLLTFKYNKYTIVTGLSYEQQKLQNPWQKMNWNPVTGAPVGSIQDFSNPSTNFTDEVDRSFTAVYSELLYDVTKDIRINFGLRYDYYSDFGGTLNPRVGATWAINKDNIFKFMYGEAFRAPTFAELHNKNNPSIKGNPNLNPEMVKTHELSFQNSSIDDLQASITLFYTDIKDIIILENTIYTNKGQVTTKGAELEAKYNLRRGSYLLANYTYQKPENELTGDELENISNHEAYLGLNYRIDRHFNLYADAKFIGKQTRSTSDTREAVQSSITSNATLLAKDIMLKDLEMKFSIYNLFDEKSYDSYSPYDYPLGGRTYMAQLSYKF